MEGSVFDKGFFVLEILKIIQGIDTGLCQILQHEIEDLCQDIGIVVGTVGNILIVRNVVGTAHIAQTVGSSVL